MPSPFPLLSLYVSLKEAKKQKNIIIIIIIMIIIIIIIQWNLHITKGQGTGKICSL